MPSPAVFRFAPSPNGYLHLGHALSALINADAARFCAGRLLLRIEDIDPARCRPEFEAAILGDLEWLGIHFERPVRRQSEHLEFHRSRFETLRRRGLVYPCFCSRAKLRRAVAALEARSGEKWPRDPDGAWLYPGLCRDLDPNEAAKRVSAGEPHAWRLRVARASEVTGPLAFREHDAAEPRSPWRGIEAEPLAWGDVVLLRRDAPSSYHLAVTLDDAAQGVTQVVRGMDLRPATSVHRLLRALLELPEPSYHHHRLVLDEEGRKLSKSIASTSLRELRASGMTALDIRRRVGLSASGPTGQEDGFRR
ncbi:MAG: tRNA glutamyl-Q(34) synthetase GluQRS [Hyphomicrobiales bacterium]|nr:tRNA glutamyl-Q(34) synthetase GluQRS [Hyphomicrobiales bacterium]